MPFYARPFSFQRTDLNSQLAAEGAQPSPSSSDPCGLQALICRLLTISGFMLGTRTFYISLYRHPNSWYPCEKSCVALLFLVLLRLHFTSSYMQACPVDGPSLPPGSTHADPNHMQEVPAVPSQ